jgi:hypothetical protein
VGGRYSSRTAGNQHQPASSRAIAALATYGIQQHTLDAAEMFRDYDITIEAGPDRHGITQGAFLYVFESGGNRIELFGDPGFLELEPLTTTEKLPACPRWLTGALGTAAMAAARGLSFSAQSPDNWISIDASAIHPRRLGLSSARPSGAADPMGRKPQRQLTDGDDQRPDRHGCGRIMIGRSCAATAFSRRRPALALALTWRVEACRAACSAWDRCCRSAWPGWRLSPRTKEPGRRRASRSAGAAVP